MDERITDADLQMLFAQNVLAAEQLRRIIAERLLGELKERLEGVSNGAVTTDISSETTIETA